MAHFKNLVVYSSVRVFGKILGKLNGKITICGKTWDGSSDITI